MCSVFGWELAITGIYSTISGLWGIVVTDVIQFVIAMTSCVILAVVAVNHLGGVEQMQMAVNAEFGGGSASPFDLLPSFSGDSAIMPLSVFFIMLFVQWWATKPKLT